MAAEPEAAVVEAGAAPARPQAAKPAKKARAAKAPRRADAFSTFPAPRRVVCSPELTQKYTKPGYLQFVNGYDKRFTQHSLDWQDMHPDLTRQYYDPEEAKTALPPSWPPNLVLLAPEQQVGTVQRKPVHGGWRWPGHAAPKINLVEDLIQSLPGPLRKFFS